MSIRERILSVCDLPQEPAIIPEWGIGSEDAVFIRGMTAAERDSVENYCNQRKGKDGKVDITGLMAQVVICTLVDAKGQPIFAPPDLPALQKKSAVVIGRLFEKARELSGMTQKEVEELTKNSGSGPRAASPSA
jgi:hypothetical protein